MPFFASILQKDKARKASKRLELQVETTAGASAIAGAIDTITGGSVKAVDMSQDVSDESGYGTGNLGREVLFQFEDADGNILPMRVRGVLDTYINVGGDIDVTNEDVIAFVSAVTTNVKLSDGQVPTSLRKAFVVD